VPQNGDIVLIRQSIGGKTHYFMIDNVSPERYDRTAIQEEDGIARLAVQHASTISADVMEEESRLP